MVPTMTRSVRVTGIRNGTFVEFEFAMAEGALSVDLIMPFAAFEEFCRDQRATVLAPVPGVDGTPSGAPGLYRRPDAAATSH